MRRMGRIRHERLMRPETNQKGGNGISAERTERGRGCVGNAADGTHKGRVGNATDGTRCNHEIWATCPNLLTKTEKIQLVNRILADIGKANGRGLRDTLDQTEGDHRKNNVVLKGMRAFEEVYEAKKHTAYIRTKADWAPMKALLEKLSEKVAENGTYGTDGTNGTGAGAMVVDDRVRIDALRQFLEAVSQMKNDWYFKSAFTPMMLNSKFNQIYSELLNNSDHGRRKAAFDYL